MSSAFSDILCLIVVKENFNFYQLLALKEVECPWQYASPLKTPLTWSSCILWFPFLCNC